MALFCHYVDRSYFVLRAVFARAPALQASFARYYASSHHHNIMRHGNSRSTGGLATRNVTRTGRSSRPGWQPGNVLLRGTWMRLVSRLIIPTQNFIESCCTPKPLLRHQKLSPVFSSQPYGVSLALKILLSRKMLVKASKRSRHSLL